MNIIVLQGGDICTPEGRTCIEEASLQNFSCSVNCEGMYADIQKTREEGIVPVQHEKTANCPAEGEEANRKKIVKLVNEYNAYKRKKLQNFRFNPAKVSTQFGNIFQEIPYLLISFPKGEEQPPSTLKLVQIYLDTATFDEIERDEKVKFTAALSLVGGTMGLLTGFSIISGIEVVFFLVKLVSPLLVNFVKQKAEDLKRRFVST